MRRGELTTEEMAGLMLLAATAVVLVAFWARAHGAIAGESEIEACRTSVTNYAKLWIEYGPADTHLGQSIDCERRVITFTDGKVELNGKKTSFFDPATNKTRSSYRELTPGIVNSVAASELAVCWHEFLEGKSYWTNDVDPNNDKTACFVCAELRFHGAPAYEATPFLPFLEAQASRPYPKGIPKNPITGEPERPTYLEYLYLQDHLCDHSGVSRFPSSLLNDNLLKEPDWIKYVTVGDGKTWYRKEEGLTCQEQFYSKVLVGPVQKGSDFALTFTPIAVAPIIPSVFYDYYDPPMRDLTLTPDRSYFILFYQLGQDEGKGEDGEPEGTTYAPVIVPAEKFSTSMCTTYLG